MKTTLVKERIDEIVETAQGGEGCFCCGTADAENCKSVATKSIQALVDDECIKARIDCLKITHGHMHTGTALNDQYFMHNITMLEAELKATESPLKPVKEK